ncbi:hypothetical protein [Moorena producens]|nr:hypothetical protein [Moorena producens]
MPVVLKVELASCQWFYKWNWHLASDQYYYLIEINTDFQPIPATG